MALSAIIYKGVKMCVPLKVFITFGKEAGRHLINACRMNNYLQNTKHNVVAILESVYFGGRS